MRTATRLVVLGRKQLWTPAALGSSLALWLDADDFSTITLNGSNVAQWSDKSGNGRHATQATAASQPAYNATGLNGKPALITDDVDNRMNLPVITAAAGIALFFAVRQQARIGINRNGGILYASNNQSSNHFGGLSNPDWYDSFYSTSRPLLANLVPVGDYIGSLTQTGSQIVADLQSVTTLAQPSAAFLATPAQMVIGSPAGSTQSAIRYGELVLVQSPSDTDRQKLEGYLAWKWGLTADLPSDHLFKFTPPYI